MTEPLFKPSNRWVLPEYGKIMFYGRCIGDSNPTTQEFAQILSLGPEKARSYLEHLRACFIADYHTQTRRYTPTTFFSNLIQNQFNETDVAALLYFNYVHYMSPVRWLTLEFFNELFYSGVDEVSKPVIFQRWCEEFAIQKQKSLREAIQSLVGVKSELSAFYSLHMHIEEGENILLSSFSPNLKVLALTFSWAWRRNFGKEIKSLDYQQILASPEFPFKTFRMSISESIGALDELNRQKIIRLVKSADLDQVYFNYPDDGELYSY